MTKSEIKVAISVLESLRSEVTKAAVQFPIAHPFKSKLQSYQLSIQTTIEQLQGMYQMP